MMPQSPSNRHLGTSRSFPGISSTVQNPLQNLFVGIAISCLIVFSLISSTVWNFFPFKGDFSFVKRQKSLATKSGLLGVWVTWVARLCWLQPVQVQHSHMFCLLQTFQNVNHFQEIFLMFKIFYLFIFRERGREGEREGEKHQCVVASHTPPTGDLACNPCMCPDRESNWWPFPSQSNTQSTESHQPGHSEEILDDLWSVCAILLPVQNSLYLFLLCTELCPFSCWCL